MYERHGFLAGIESSRPLAVLIMSCNAPAPPPPHILESSNETDPLEIEANVEDESWMILDAMPVKCASGASKIGQKNISRWSHS